MTVRKARTCSRLSEGPFSGRPIAFPLGQSTHLGLADDDGVLVHDPDDVFGVGLGGEGAGVGVVASLLQVGEHPGEEVSVGLDLAGVGGGDPGDLFDELLEVGVLVAIEGLKAKVNSENQLPTMSFNYYCLFY